MQILNWTFKLLTVCGCWRPPSWSSRLKRLIYHMYTIAIITLVYTSSLAQLMDIILNVETIDDFNENFYMLVEMAAACFKLFGILLNRENIMLLMNAFEEEPFAPVDPEEVKIQMRFDEISRINSIRYVSIVEGTVVLTYVNSLFTVFRKRQLTFRSWLPYDYSAAIVFEFTYVYQLAALCAASLLHVACDSLIVGLLVHTCSQMEFLEHRLQQIKPSQQNILKKCARHHYLIYRFTEAFNECFQIVFFFQFLVSTLAVSVSLYQATNTNGLGAKYLEMLFYVLCMLLQIFLYCWYGNEVKLKSLDVCNSIFQMDWITLDRDSKSIVLIIMKRATEPIKFTSAHIFSMDLDTFVNILRTSYSAYNLLQTA